MALTAADLLYFEQERQFLQRQLDRWREQEFANIRRRGKYDRVLTKDEAAAAIKRCEEAGSLWAAERANYLRRLYFWTVDDIPVQCY